MVAHSRYLYLRLLPTWVRQAVSVCVAYRWITSLAAWNSNSLSHTYMEQCCSLSKGISALFIEKCRDFCKCVFFFPELTMEECWCQRVCLCYNKERKRLCVVSCFIKKRVKRKSWTLSHKLSYCERVRKTVRCVANDGKKAEGWGREVETAAGGGRQTAECLALGRGAFPALGLGS